MSVEERLPRGLYSLKVSWRLNQGGVVGNVRSRDNPAVMQVMLEAW